MRTRARILRTAPVVGLVAAAFAVLFASPALASPALASTASVTPAQPATIVRQFVRITPSADGQSTTYSITRETAALEPGVSAASVAAVPLSAIASCPTDGSISVQLCATINYNSLVSGTNTYAHTNSWQNQVTRLDPQAILVDLQWNATQQGHCLSGCSGFLNKTFTGDYSPPISAHTYTVDPPWNENNNTQPYTQIIKDPAAANIQCMNQNLIWKHGTHTLNLPNISFCVPAPA